MKINYDTSADSLYIKLKRGRVFKTKKIGLELIDYNQKGEMIGLEILNYSKKAPAAERKSIPFIGHRRLPVQTVS